MQAVGFVEISGVVAATCALDAMCKAAAVRLAGRQSKWGGRLVTIIIEGEVSAVQAALAAANSGVKQPVATAIIPNPHPEIKRLIKREKRGEYD